MQQFLITNLHNFNLILYIVISIPYWPVPFDKLYKNAVYMSLNTDNPWLRTVVGTCRVPYIRKVVQFIGDELIYLSLFLIISRIWELSSIVQRWTV
jgi:hypothetical protein